MAEEFRTPQSANEALLQNILGAENEIREPQSVTEYYLKKIWEEGTGGGDFFIVTIDVSDSPFTSDKNYQEINDAIESGKIVVGKITIPFDSSGHKSTIYLSSQTTYNGVMFVGSVNRMMWYGGERLYTAVTTPVKIFIGKDNSVSSIYQDEPNIKRIYNDNGQWVAPAFDNLVVETSFNNVHLLLGLDNKTLETNMFTKKCGANVRDIVEMTASFVDIDARKIYYVKMTRANSPYAELTEIAM